MTETYKKIAIKDIVANPYQPRLHFNEDELKELATSISLNGLIQPIIVRKSEVFGYELIAGERRLRASQIAGLTEIPAIIKTISNSESMNQAIIENLQRSNLNPIEEAKAFQSIIDKNQLTHDQLATYMGKSRPYITNTIRLLQLSTSVLDAIEKKTISSGHAHDLLALSTKEEQDKYLNYIISQNLNVRQTESLIRKSKVKKEKKKEKTLFTKAIENELAKSLGLAVSISLNKDGSGQCHFTFHNDDELNRIINKLK
ncbi:ParB/RepB/Spo0J family partition protein [Streptococcus iniae]|nr:ParB/RepB/Spo0J family partition protein [Streptococcus iniae]